MDNICLWDVNDDFDDDIFHSVLDCGLDGPDNKALIAGFGGDMYFELYCEDPRALSLDDVPGDDPRWDVCSSRIGWV